MKKKIVLTALCFITAVFIAGFLYVLAGTHKAESLLIDYLNEKGYHQNEIESIQVTHSFLNILLSYPEWSVAVVFSDEPTSIYYYHMDGGIISEGGVSGLTAKEDLKHLSG